MEGESKVCTFRRGDVVFGESERSVYIAFILSGNVVRRKRENSRCYERLTQGDLVGLESLFSQWQSASDVIVATRETRVLFLSKAAILKVLQMDPDFSLAVIHALAARITELERRVTTYTGGDAQCRLARYLLSAFQDANTFELHRSMQQLATMLDISRPSLYRAFANIEETGAVEREGKTIRLLDKDALLANISREK